MAVLETGAGSWTFTSLQQAQRREGGELAVGKAIYSQSPSPKVLPSAGQLLLILPKHPQQLEAKCPNAHDHRKYFSFEPQYWSIMPC